MKTNWRTVLLVATAAVAAATAVLVAVYVVVPEIRSRGKDPAEELAARAEALYKEGKYAEAQKLYERVLADYAGSPVVIAAVPKKNQCQAKALFTEARYLARGGHYAEASELLGKAASLAPDDVEVNYGVGWVYVQLAVDNLTNAQYSGGRAAGDFYLLAATYLDLARARFERCVALDAKNWAGYRGLAMYYIFKREYDKALDAAGKADVYSREPADKVAVGRLRVQAYLGQRKYDDAKKVIDALLAKYPVRGEAYYALAEYYLLAEKPDVAEAAKAIETGLGKQFEDEGSRNQMYAMLARMKRDNRDYAGALDAAAAGLNTDPFNENLLKQYTLAFGERMLAGGPPKK